jgi:hypothetical protein
MLQNLINMIVELGAKFAVNLDATWYTDMIETYQLM